MELVHHQNIVEPQAQESKGPMQHAIQSGTHGHQTTIT